MAERMTLASTTPELENNILNVREQDRANDALEGGGASQTSFFVYPTLVEAIRATLNGDRNVDIALTKEQAELFLARYAPAAFVAAEGGLESQPVTLVRETHDDTDRHHGRCPHCDRNLGSESDTRCGHCGLGLNLLHFTEVTDDDLTDYCSPEEYVNGYEWFRLWKR